MEGCTWCLATIDGAVGLCTRGDLCIEPLEVCGSAPINYQPPPCPDSCSGHGTCVNQQCVCDSGWKGINCGAASGLTAIEGVAVGLGAGVVVAIGVGVAIFCTVSAGGAVGAYRYLKFSKQSTTAVEDNPFYEPAKTDHENPLFERGRTTTLTDAPQDVELHVLNK